MIINIISVLKTANVACSVKRIAELMGCETSSEVLNSIKYECFEAVDSGVLVATKIIETEQVFFSVA